MNLHNIRLLYYTVLKVVSMNFCHPDAQISSQYVQTYQVSTDAAMVHTVSRFYVSRPPARFHPDHIQEFLAKRKKKSEGWKCAVRFSLLPDRLKHRPQTSFSSFSECLTDPF